MFIADVLKASTYKPDIMFFAKDYITHVHLAAKSEGIFRKAYLAYSTFVLNIQRIINIFAAALI